MGRLSRERMEYRRTMVERLLQSELSVDEWSKQNGVCKATIYNWLSEFARTEPELFGGKHNIADTEKRNWIQITRKNIADSHALALRELSGVLIADADSSADPASGNTNDVATFTPSIQLAIKGVRIAIASGTHKSDIENVLTVVASL